MCLCLCTYVFVFVLLADEGKEVIEIWVMKGAQGRETLSTSLQLLCACSPFSLGRLRGDQPEAYFLPTLDRRGMSAQICLNLII